MVNPLQDQLLKAGLIKANQLKKVAKEKRQAQRSNTPDLEVDHARQAQLRKAESDRIRNREQQADRERKAQTAQIRQLIATQRLTRSGGDCAFQFADGGKIKKIHMHAAQRAQLIKGTLGLVKLDQAYELVPAATTEKIALRDPGCVMVFNAQSAPPTDPASDPYADHPIPDDLMW